MKKPVSDLFSISDCVRPVPGPRLLGLCLETDPSPTWKSFKQACQKKISIFCCVLFTLFSIPAFADYTVASGANINASTLTGQSGVLTINGTLTLSSNVSLLGFTSVVITGPSGQIYWTNNSDLIFSAGISISIASTSPGLMPTVGAGNASQRLIVGTIIISVSSDNSNVAAFSFEDFNEIGGLPQFTLTSNSPVCNAAVALNITPDRTSDVYFNYDWSISPSSGTFTADNTNSLSNAATTISPASGTYTITCTVRANGNIFASRSTTVITSSPATPAAIAATPSTICASAGTNLNTTSAGNTIYWYTQATGGTSIGSTTSGANFTVYPATTTSYYAQAVSASGCASSARTAAKTVTVNAQPAITGTLTLCAGATTQLAGTGTPATLTPWQSSSTSVATVNSTGLVTGVAGGTATITYTNSSGCSISAVVTVVTLPVITGSTSVCIGYTIQLAATGTAAVTPWISGTPGVATINNTGLLSPVAAGTTLVTYTNSTGCTKTVTITVNQPAAITAQPVASPVCMGSNATITAAAVGTEASYQWELSHNNGTSWTDVPNNALYAGTTTNSLQVISPGIQVITNLYRLRVSTPSGCGNTVWSNNTLFAFKNVWLGGTSTDWNNAANWSDGALPTLSCPAVYIINRVNQPVLGSGTAAINSLVIYSGTLTVTNAVLSIAGTISNSGGMDVSNGTLSFGGSSLQTIAGSYFVNNSLKNLVINNPAGVSVIANTASDSLNIGGAISFGSVNNASLLTGDRVVLVSNVTGTARLNDLTNNGVNSGNTIVGKVTVQRYFPARRSWRLFTAPLSGAGSVFDNWQNGGNFRAGTGTYVTAPQATNPMGANGLDWSVQNNSSLKMGTGLSSVINTHTALLSRNVADTADNIPYFMFVRGDRLLVNTNVPNVNTTTLSSKGKLQTGRQTFTASPASDGFTLIGNPYAAPVDFSKLSRTNLYKRMYVWDPYLNTDLGGYVLVDDVDNDGTYDISPPSPGGLDHILQSGQAFWVQTINNGSASLAFQETSKSSAGSNLTAFRPQAPTPAMSINITQPGVNSKPVLLDGFLVQYAANFNKQADMQDAIKFINSKETIASERSGKSLALERRPLITGDDTIFIKLTKTTQRSYDLQLVPTGFNEELTAFLEDAYTGTKTQLPISQPSKYNFAISSAAASAAANRFRVVFRQTAPVIPPFSFGEIAARKEGGYIPIEWVVRNEIKGNEYYIEKSTDGISYSTIDSITTVIAHTGNKSYKSLDRNPAYGSNFYRVRYKNNTDSLKYSKAVEVLVSNGTTGFGVYPNPVADGIMNVAFNKMPAGQYVARLINTNGATVLMKEVRHPGGTSLLPIILDKKTLHGVFLLEMHCPDNNTRSIKVLVK